MADTFTIPWAKETKVGHFSYIFIALDRGVVSCSPYYDGSITLSRDSREEIGNFLTKDEPRTAELQAWFQDEWHGGKFWRDMIRRWVTGEDPAERGIKDWRPKRGAQWKIGKHGHANTFNFTRQDWVGDVFEYTHFVDEHGGEGLVIMWDTGVDVYAGYTLPEIWRGDVDRFLASQRENDLEKDAAAFERWNDYFENGLVWAFGQLEVLGSKRQPSFLPALLKKRPELLRQVKDAS